MNIGQKNTLFVITLVVLVLSCDVSLHRGGVLLARISLCLGLTACSQAKDEQAPSAKGGHAVDRPTGLPPGAGKKQVLKAIEGHVLAQTKLMGTYGR